MEEFWGERTLREDITFCVNYIFIIVLALTFVYTFVESFVGGTSVKILLFFMSNCIFSIVLA